MSKRTTRKNSKKINEVKENVPIVATKVKAEEKTEKDWVLPPSGPKVVSRLHPELHKSFGHPLPKKFNNLLHLFTTMENIVFVKHGRNMKTTFESVAKSVMKCTKMSFDEEHLSKIIGVYPNAYKLRWEQRRQQLGKHFSKANFDLILEPNLTDDITAFYVQTSATKLNAERKTFRKMIFRHYLVLKVKDAHSEFLDLKNISVTTIDLLHPEFDIESVDQLPCGEIPILPDLSTPLRSAVEYFKTITKVEEEVVENSEKIVEEITKVDAKAKEIQKTPEKIVQEILKTPIKSEEKFLSLTKNQREVLKSPTRTLFENPQSPAKRCKEIPQSPTKGESENLLSPVKIRQANLQSPVKVLMGNPYSPVKALKEFQSPVKVLDGNLLKSPSKTAKIPPISKTVNPTGTPKMSLLERIRAREESKKSADKSNIALENQRDALQLLKKSMVEVICSHFTIHKVHGMNLRSLLPLVILACGQINKEKFMEHIDALCEAAPKLCRKESLRNETFLKISEVRVDKLKQCVEDRLDKVERELRVLN